MTFQVGSRASVEAGLAPTDVCDAPLRNGLGASTVLRRCGDADLFARWRRPGDYRCRIGDCAAREEDGMTLVYLLVGRHVRNVGHCARERTVMHLHNVPPPRSQALVVQPVFVGFCPVQPVAIPEQFAVTMQRVSGEHERADLIQQRA